MKDFLKRFILNLIMSIVVIMFPFLAIIALIIIIQCISYHSGTELFLLCFGAILYILFVYSLIITIFQKIDVYIDKLRELLNI